MSDPEQELPPVFPGSAPEILQARIKSRFPADATLDAPAVELPAIPAEHSQGDSLVNSTPELQSNPFIKQLETLPDEDLKKLATERGVKFDGRWGRDKLVQALVDAASVVPPPPLATSPEPVIGSTTEVASPATASTETPPAETVAPATPEVPPAS